MKRLTVLFGRLDIVDDIPTHCSEGTSIDHILGASQSDRRPSRAKIHSGIGNRVLGSTVVVDAPRCCKRNGASVMIRLQVIDYGSCS